MTGAREARRAGAQRARTYARALIWRCLTTAVAVWLAGQFLGPPSGQSQPPGPGVAHAEVTQEQLQGRIDGLIADIKGLQKAGGQWSERDGSSRNYMPVGQTALAVLALRSAGVPADDPAVSKGIGYLLDNHTDQTYEAALKIMALEAVDAGKHHDEIARIARYLCKIQCPSGGWSYGDTCRLGRTDNSNSQFGILGIHSAARCGVDIPAQVWEKAKTYYVRGQNRDGGWGYQQGDNQSYGSMTAAGTASLYLCDLRLHVHAGVCGEYPDQSRFQSGLTWLANSFSVTRNPGRDMWKFYYLYSLERVGVLCARRYLGRHDWYLEGVEHLVADPVKMVEAPSTYEWPLIRKCWMLLFLVKGNAPVLIHKAGWDGIWNRHRYDVKFLVDFIGKQFGREMSWQIIPLNAPLDHLMAAPILYVSGAGEVRWDEVETKNFKEYVQAGGFVVAEANGGDEAFDRTFRKFLEDNFPDQQLAPLPKGHAIYDCFFNLPGDARADLEALAGPCWLSVLYAPDGLSCPWDVARFSHSNFKLGANIVAYVTGLERPRGKLEKPEFSLPPSEDVPLTRDAFVVGQVVHEGGWQPHRDVWRRILHKVNVEADVAVYSRPIALDLDRDTPFQAHMINIIGSREFELSQKAVEKLRLYVERGGFIFAEAACSSEEFDRSFRQLVGQLFPEGELRPMPLGHPLFELGRSLDEVQYNRTVRQQRPDLRRPALEYVETDGRTVLVYSKYDLGCAVAGHPCFNCRAVLEPSASELMVKVVLYALAS